MLFLYMLFWMLIMHNEISWEISHSQEPIPTPTVNFSEGLKWSILQKPIILNCTIFRIILVHRTNNNLILGSQVLEYISLFLVYCLFFLDFLSGNKMQNDGRAYRWNSFLLSYKDHFEFENPNSWTLCDFSEFSIKWNKKI